MNLEYLKMMCPALAEFLETKSQYDTRVAAHALEAREYALEVWNAAEGSMHQIGHFKEADLCESCNGTFIGVSDSTKWCPYCGARHEGETVPLGKLSPSPEDYEMLLRYTHNLRHAARTLLGMSRMSVIPYNEHELVKGELDILLKRDIPGIT